MYCLALRKVAGWIGDRIILFLLLNIYIFYYPLNSRFPHFLFLIRMYIKQIIEGIIGILECLIPRYEEEQSKKKTKI